MTWTCAAIDHGVTVFNDGKISPCCVINHNYRKDIKDLNNDPFKDLRTGIAPSECSTCTKEESHGISSYRNYFNKKRKNIAGYQFIDIRNSNICNLSCRSCGPHFSSTWAKELSINPNIKKQDIDNLIDIIDNDSVQEIYFTGGEPLIFDDHWKILDILISTKRSKKIDLRYNSNYTVVSYKQKSVFEYWKEFKSVNISASIDAIGEKNNFLRSGSDWSNIKSNLDETLKYKDNISLSVTNTLSNLNIWFLSEYLEYFKNLGIRVNLNILNFPDYFSLSCLPDEMKDLALEQISKSMEFSDNKNVLYYAEKLIKDNSNQHLFMNTLANILLLDKLRGEKLFDYLPMKQIAINQIINNNG